MSELHLGAWDNLDDHVLAETIDDLRAAGKVLQKLGNVRLAEDYMALSLKARIALILRHQGDEAPQASNK